MEQVELGGQIWADFGPTQPQEKGETMQRTKQSTIFPCCFVEHCNNKQKKLILGSRLQRIQGAGGGPYPPPLQTFSAASFLICFAWSSPTPSRDRTPMPDGSQEENLSYWFPGFANYVPVTPLTVAVKASSAPCVIFLGAGVNRFLSPNLPSKAPAPPW